MRVLLQRRVLAAEGAALAAVGRTADALRHFSRALTEGTVCSRDFDTRVLLAMAQLLFNLNQPEGARRVASLAGAHVSGPREFVFVLDYSSSMAEHRLIDAAVDNILELYDTYVLPIDRVCLITFTRRAVVRVEPRRKGTGRRAAKTRALMDACRTPRGGTACYDGILAAMLQQSTRAAAQTETGARRRPTSARFIVVVTDGEDTTSRATALDTAALLREACKHTPLAVHIVGVGQLANEQELRAIAAASRGGQFVPAGASRHSIDAAFNHITAAVAEVYVEAV
jgi:Mg-chelatase subunit ChlD